MMYTVYRKFDAVEGLAEPVPAKELEAVLTEDGVKALRLFVLAQRTDAYKGVAFNVCELTGAHGFCEKKECEGCEGMTMFWVRRHWGF
jgi:hypothetical protein